LKNLKTIISGGQTGVDQAALRAALELDFRIGGWCPPGWMSQNPVIPSEFALTETEKERSSNAPDIPRSQRTEYNVRDSDATLILYPHIIRNDPGTEYTIQCARQYKKPFLVVDPYAADAFKLISNWLKETSVGTLNIAGPSEGTLHGIYDQTRRLIYGILLKMKSGKTFNDSHPDNRE
jgi:hypothetical protein